LANINDFDRFDSAYREFFSGVMPARTTVQSVLWGGIKVEIDVIARVPSAGLAHGSETSMARRLRR
jgi:2-iminobutanoate/2-iminopropanoate deaminase